MRLAVLVVSRNRPDLVERLAGWLGRNVEVDHDLFVVEAGTDPERVSPLATARYDDPDFHGKCLAHGLALEQARARARETGVDYDHYWVLMNDVELPEGSDAARALVDTMEREPRMAILSPTCEDGAYPGSARRPGGGWRAVATCDYLGFLIRARAVEEVGFLNPAFRYCWGAIHELSHHLYRDGWFVAYSDDVTYRHLGGTTYGAAGTGTIPREEYLRRAKRFAYAYFLKVYGPDWAERFWAAAAGHGIEIDTYALHRDLWAEGFGDAERARLHAELAREPGGPCAVAPPRGGGSGLALPDRPRPLRLHLGSGGDRREGWVNVDVNEERAPDLVASAGALSMLESSCAEAIEACHLFEHLTLREARAALREWRRLLVPGGELALELPNLDACIRLIGTELDGHDLGMISLFGYPPEIDAEGVPQLHKWGWTPATLRAELEAAGFVGVREVPVTQTWRKAARYERDMRLVARAPGGAREAEPSPGAPAELAARVAPAAPGEPAAPLAPTQRVFAWPDWEDAGELDRFLHVFARLRSRTGCGGPLSPCRTCVDGNDWSRNEVHRGGAAPAIAGGTAERAA